MLGFSMRSNPSGRFASGKAKSTRGGKTVEIRPRVGDSRPRLRIPTKATEPLDKARKKEGRYFANVLKIVKTEGGIPALIGVLDSTNEEDAAHAHTILCRLSLSLPESRQLNSPIPKDSAYWNTWWTQLGSKMSPQTMESNFDSYWK